MEDEFEQQLNDEFDAFKILDGRKPALLDEIDEGYEFHYDGEIYETEAYGQQGDEFFVAGNKKYEQPEVDDF